MGGRVFPEMKPGQLDPGRRPAGEKASYPCPHPRCMVETQGGLAGLAAHRQVVHGERPQC
jgi:hypothetical protein